MILFKKKFTYKKSKSCKILVLSKDLTLKNYKNINISFEIINIYYLLIALKNFIFKNKNNHNLKSIYLQIYLLSFNPKLIIGNNVDLRIFRIKKLLPDVTCICYQFGYVTKSTAKKLYKNSKFNCDYFLAFHKNDIRIFKSYIKSQFIVTGSIKNNFTSKLYKKRKYITFISEYKKIYLKNMKFKKIEYIKYIVKCLEEFCKKNNYKLLIALRSNRNDKNLSRKDEINFYKNLLKINFSTNINQNPYRVAEKSIVCVGIHSNLCYELLSRDEKVLFINLNKSLYPPVYQIRKKKLIFIEKKSKTEIFEKLNKLINLSVTSWKKYSKNLNKIYFDSKNIQFLNLIKKSLNR